MDFLEDSNVLVVSSSGNKNNVNTSIFDVKQGTLLAVFNEGTSARNCLTFIRDDYILSAFNDREIIKYWSLSKNFQDAGKMPVPGHVSVLAIDSLGMFCVAGIDKSFYIWEVATGNLIMFKESHSQAITCIRFTCDGSHFVTGGKDGIVHVWMISDCVSDLLNYTSGTLKPRYIWMDHSAEITDIFVGNFSVFSRIVTTSKDTTCRVYELMTGLLMTTVRTDHTVTAVAMDVADMFMVLGFGQGDIARINFYPREDAEVFCGKDNEQPMFLGHNDEITGLSLSPLSKFLASGSADKSCIIWEVSSFSMLRKIPFDGPVTNIFIIPMPYGLKENTRLTPSVPFNPPFKREIDSEDSGTMIAQLHDQKLSIFHLGSPDQYLDSRTLNLSAECVADLAKSGLPPPQVNQINSQIYSYALSNVFLSAPDSSGLKDEDD